MFISFGTILNVGTVVAGSLIGLFLGERLPARLQLLVTQTCGLITLVLGGFSVISLAGRGLTELVGANIPIVILVLGLVSGALFGSGLQLEFRLERLAEKLRTKFGRADDSRFSAGFITATLVFCVGPMTILGSISDGLGRGFEVLAVKSVLDGFMSIAFAASLGYGVLLSAISVGVIQGVFTFMGWLAGDFLRAGYIDALTATGGVLLLALGLRILGVTRIAVTDLLPALIMTPALVWVAARFVHLN